ncbi:MAG: glycosyltransferase family 4 protein [Pirellula sp.]|jgi:phosphatidylinositol alpha-1,6-mannosyltransferase
MYTLISEIFPPVVGGSGKWFYEIFRRLPADQYQIVTDWVPQEGGHEGIPLENIHRIPFLFEDTGALTWKGYQSYDRIKRIILETTAQKTPRVIIAGRMIPEGWIASSVARKRKAKLVCFAHGEEINKDQISGGGVMSSRQHRWMGARIAKVTDHWIANSQNTRNILLEQWSIPSSRVTVVHPGVETHYFCPAPRNDDFRSRMGWKDRKVLLTVGRLQKRKGHDFLIQSLPNLLTYHPNLLYVIIGDGEEKMNLERLVSNLGLEHEVHFLGKADDDIVRQCYQQSDLFILPNRSVGSDIEGFGMVLTEAGACGTPVCAGRSGGTSETMIDGKTGFLLDCSSVESLSRELHHVLSTTNLASVGFQAAQFCKENFGWDFVAKRLFQVLEDVGNS